MRYSLTFLCCLYVNVAAAQMPPHITIVFDVNRGAFNLGTGTEVLEIDGSSYSIVSQTHPTGIVALFPKANIRRESRGTIASQGLRPQQFFDRRGADEPLVAKFDWKNKLITYDGGGKERSETLPSVAYDRLCIAYNFTVHQPQGKDFQFSMTDGKSLKEYRYLMVGRENLSTPMGNMQTIHWTKQREQKTDRGADLWLAIDHYFLPVRIVFTDKDGSRYEQVATQISYH
jgi:Protein of unknown function (DUF3108)